MGAGYALHAPLSSTEVDIWMRFALASIWWRHLPFWPRWIFFATGLGMFPSIYKPVTPKHSLSVQTCHGVDHIDGSPDRHAYPATSARRAYLKTLCIQSHPFTDYSTPKGLYPNRCLIPYPTLCKIVGQMSWRSSFSLSFPCLIFSVFCRLVLDRNHMTSIWFNIIS